MRPVLILNVALAAAGLGMSPLAKKAALSAGVPPLVLSLVVVLLGACIVFGYAFAQLGSRLFRHLSGRIVVHLFFIGAMGSGAVTLLSSLAMTETTATNRSLFQAMYPVATAVCARLLLRETFPPAVYGVIALMCAGLFLMNSGSGGIEFGYAFGLLAATLPLIGLADVYAKRVLSDTQPEVVAFGRLLFGGTALLPVMLWTSPSEWRLLANESAWVIAAGVAVSAGVIGLYRSLNMESASLTAAFVALAPVVTVIAEWSLLGGRFALTQLAGVALVVGGALMLARIKAADSG